MKIGNTAASPDLTIFHSSGANYIKVINNQSLNFGTNNTNRAMFESGGHFRPIVDSTYDLGITGTRWRNVYADTLYGDGSNLTGISVGITTEALTTAGATVTLDLSKDDHKITKSGTYTITCTGGSEASAHTLRIVNSGIATVGFSTYFLFPSGGTPSLPTTNGAISLISFTVHRAGASGISTQLLGGASVNFS